MKLIPEWIKFGRKTRDEVRTLKYDVECLQKEIKLLKKLLCFDGGNLSSTYGVIYWFGQREHTIDLGKGVIRTITLGADTIKDSVKKSKK